MSVAIIDPSFSRQSPKKVLTVIETALQLQAANGRSGSPEVACARCGSIDIVRHKSSAVDKFVRLFSNRKRVICRRCGWSARIPWDHDDHYMPRMAELRAVEMQGTKSKGEGKFEEEFDINRFH